MTLGVFMNSKVSVCISENENCVLSQKYFGKSVLSTTLLWQTKYQHTFCPFEEFSVIVLGN